MKRRALISVYDKSGILDFSKQLSDLGFEIISTGGTKRYLEENGVEVTDVSEVTEFPEMMDGRVKTLHPKIHAGILARRDMEDDVRVMNEMGIDAVDIVVNNLYPFENTLKKHGVTHEEIIENIDIGGPSMIRAAAKNYKYVTVIVDPADYDTVLTQLKSEGETDIKMREYLAAKVFNLTAYYESLISQYFGLITENEYPEYFVRSYVKADDLRYGENPHQSAAYYMDSLSPAGLPNAQILHGKQLSYNNINDTNGAILAVNEFEEPAVVAVKHSNPCGIGVDKDITRAFEKARDCDKVSIFGGIVAVNRCVDVKLAEMMNDIFLEVIIASDYSDDALKILKQKKNLRLLKMPELSESLILNHKLRSVVGGLIVQGGDCDLVSESMMVMTRVKPDKDALEDLMFAYQSVKHTSSNSIVVAKDRATIGIGQGSVNRVWAVEEAISRAGNRIEGAVLASDGFFPFTDSIELIAKAGIKHIIQPGGSVKDADVIKACDEYGISMIFTNMRHFKH